MPPLPSPAPRHIDGKRTSLLSIVALALVLMAVFAIAFATPSANAQERLPNGVRTYVPPEQLVTFPATTRTDQFFGFIAPLFTQFLGKSVVDPEGRTAAIGVPITGMHYFDAFELVLDIAGLDYRETDQYFIIQPAGETSVYLSDTESQRRAGPDGVPGRSVAPVDGLGVGEPGGELAGAWSREIRISAVIFELNRSKAFEIGLDWGNLLTSGGGEGGEGGSVQFAVNTENVFEPFRSFLVAPNVVEVSTILDFFRLMETVDVGEAVARPSVTVTSGREGRIQIGSDIPVQVRDFAGNTVTQFVQTGIIINVTPTLITDAPTGDTLGMPALDFIHLDVEVERSSGRAFATGLAVDRSTANTRVLLLDNEQTIIGGLYSSDVATTRSGVPFLKDLPWWVFGLRYIFGKEQEVTTKRELVIVLQAELLDPLPMRARQAPQQDLIERHRQRVLRDLRRTDPGLTEDSPLAPTGGQD